MVVEASDRFLVAAAQAGDLHAFEALVCRHEGVVYRVALRMLGSRVDAEDAAQDALVQAWRALSRFRGESEFSTWLYRIVTNRCLKARAARHPMEALPDVLIDRDSDPAAAVAQSERLHALARGVWRCRPSSAQRWSCVSWKGRWALTRGLACLSRIDPAVAGSVMEAMRARAAHDHGSAGAQGR